MVARLIKIVGTGLVLVLVAGWWSCVSPPGEPEFDNPLDPEGDDYIDPITTIVTTPPGTVYESSVTISWQGSHELLEFSWRLDSQSWSAWASDTSITLEYLDEGDHLFEIKSRYATGEEETSPVQVEFTVDAVYNQSLLLYPYRVELVSGQPLEVQLQAHDMPSLTGVEVTLAYDGTSLQPDTALTGPFLAKDGGTTITFSEVGETWNVSTGVAQGPATGVSGSGTIITFRFDVLRVANSALTLSVVDARNPNDEEVEILMVRGSVVEVGD
ncbi:MAG: hypothetical protein JSW54_09975 [Fidelibacterota bacterium]|nr:MAG: hypothetical protein JSW54_09975 [Candidatus Neomarinimicrobiota bacterium]